MIPTYNCAHYLREAIQSVLRQDLGSHQMQIEVVDDCSNRDDPAAVVAEFGQGRVKFFRQPSNLGATGNFNSCLRRSRGRLVHLLHGDDFVLPDYYRKVGMAFEQHQGVSIVASRCFVVDRTGSIERLSQRYPSLEAPTTDGRPLCANNELYTPGVAVRRKAYEELGGFHSELVHTADWEMWLRLFFRTGGLAINAPLSSYRVHDSNDTSKLAQTGENLRDHLRLGKFASNYSDYFAEKFWRLHVGRLAREQGLRFRFAAQPNLEAAVANNRLWCELVPAHTRIVQRISAALIARLRKWGPT